jgi:hypothetical protein
MKEKEKNIYGIHQYTLTRRRKIRVEHVYVKNEGKREKHLWNTPMVECVCV